MNEKLSASLAVLVVIPLIVFGSLWKMTTLPVWLPLYLKRRHRFNEIAATRNIEQAKQEFIGYCSICPKAEVLHLYSALQAQCPVRDFPLFPSDDIDFLEIDQGYLDEMLEDMGYNNNSSEKVPTKAGDFVKFLLGMQNAPELRP